MAKTTAPLLSFDAAGQIAKTQVYAQWKGRRYARRYVTPANPNTAAQQETRGVFSFLMGAWKLSPDLFQDPWTLYAKGLVLTNRNALAKFNVSPLRGQSDLSLFVWSPGAKGGIAPSSVSATAGTGSATVTVTPPTPPPSWAVANVIAAAIADADPNTDAASTIVAGSAAASPWEITLNGLTASTLYRVGGWIEWTKPDSSTAYSIALTTSVTPT